MDGGFIFLIIYNQRFIIYSCYYTYQKWSSDHQENQSYTLVGFGLDFVNQSYFFTFSCFNNIVSKFFVTNFI